MYDHFGDEDFIDIARRVGESISEAELDGWHVRAVTSALEMVSLRSLPIDELDHFHELLTQSTARLLSERADELPFEDIEALEEALFDFGNNPDVARAAIHTALDSFIREIDNEMEDFGNVDELEQFESKLKAMIKRRGYTGVSPDRDLKYKRDRLLEDEYDRDPSDGYSAAAPKPHEIDENSDEHIQSMFADFVTAEA